MKRLHKYILAEVAGPFFIGLLTFTLVVLLHRFSLLSDLVVSKGVPPELGGRLLLAFVPMFLEITLPAALLLAVLLALGRFGADSEITAMQTAGMGMRSFAGPVMLVSILAFSASLYIGWAGVAWGNREMKATLARILSIRAGAGASEHVFQEITPDVLLFPDRMSTDGRRMDGLLLVHNLGRREPALVFARRGEFASGTTNAVGLTLLDGAVHTDAPEDNAYRFASFRSLEFRLPLALSDAINPDDPRNLTVPQLFRKIREKGTGKEGATFIYHFHRRLSLAASCLAFGLAAVPLGLFQRARGKSPALAITVAVILFYYMFLAAAGAVESSSRIGMILLMWLPNLLVFGGAVVIFRMSETGIPAPPRILTILSARR
ncbi:MAG TPA: LptF/LptG family permease [Candidatus Deferrimicrobiaceae bacterium]